MSECVLLGEFGWSIQGVLGFLSLCTLIIKRQVEFPRRPWLIWGLDASKQALGSLFVHFLNMIFAASQAFLSRQKGDVCEWYWINIVLDTTLGVLLSYFILRLITQSSYFTRSYTKFGHYGDPPTITSWIDQLIIWLLVTFLMKVIVVFFITIASTIFLNIAKFLLQSMDERPGLKLLAVMIVTPAIMNCLQYWITDSFLKFKKYPTTDDFLVARIADVSKSKILSV